MFVPQKPLKPTEKQFYFTFSSFKANLSQKKSCFRTACILKTPEIIRKAS